MSRLLAMSVALIVTVAAVSVADDAPTTPSALDAEAMKAIKRQDFDLALSYINKAIKLTPNNPDLYHTRVHVYRGRNEHGKASADLKTISGIYDQKIADISESIRLSPDSDDAYCKRSWTYCSRAGASNEQSDYEMAVADITVAIQLKPNHVDYYRHRAWYYYNLGKIREAKRDEATAAEIEKDQ